MSKLFVPHDYQREAIKFLIENPYAGLFADPGLGKTMMALSAFKVEQRLGLCKAALVIGPMRVAANVWSNEITKWANTADLSATFLHGPERVERFHEQHDIYTINPEGLFWLYDEMLKGRRNWPFDYLIVDESSKFKNASGKRLKKLLSKLSKFKRRRILTGTPAPNSLRDVFAQMLLVDGGATFGNREGAFLRRYFEPCGFKNKSWRIIEGAEPKIYERLAPYIMRLSAVDHLDMPPILFNRIEVELPPKARLQYEEFEKELLIEITLRTGQVEEVSASTASVLYGKCQQFANGAVYKDQDPLAKKQTGRQRGFNEFHNQKIEALIDLVNELNGKPLLIAYNFSHDYDRIEAALKKAKVKFGHIGSGVSPAKSEKVRQDFINGKIDYIVGHPASMGHGVDGLQQRCNDVVFFSLTDNYENYEQFYKRIWRQGIDAQVRVHLICCKETVDDLIYHRLQDKENAQTTLLDALQHYRQMKLDKVRDYGGSVRSN